MINCHVYIILGRVPRFYWHVSTLFELNLPQILMYAIRTGSWHVFGGPVVQLQVLESEGGGEGKLLHTLNKLRNYLAVKSGEGKCVATSK